MDERIVDQFDLTGRFFEAPRWRQGRWWVSDMSAQTVYSLSAQGDAHQELKLNDRPSGLGWLPDGSMIVVSMDRRVILRLRPDEKEAVVHADLGALCGDKAGYINDMVVSFDGHAYVGFDPDVAEYGFTSELGAILHVNPNGDAEIAALGLHFPNGMVLSADGSSLIVAETGTPRLTHFARDANGGLGERTTWAEVSAGRDRREARDRPVAQGAILLDGCALDADGCVWVANANSPSCLRVAKGGDILDAVLIPDNYRCLASALGGPDGRTLLLCGVDLGAGGEDMANSRSHLFVTQVDA